MISECGLASPARAVRDVVSQCVFPDHPRIDLARVRYIVLHRISLARFEAANPHPVPDDEIDGPALAGRFRNHGLKTGGRPPYHLLNRTGGQLDQMLALTHKGAHAGKEYNRCSIAVACVGDFRETPLPQAQRESLVWVLGQLTLATGGATIVGHTTLPGSSSDPNKVCPGKRMLVLSLAAEVSKSLPEGWRGNEALKAEALARFVV